MVKEIIDFLNNKDMTRLDIIITSISVTVIIFLLSTLLKKSCSFIRYIFDRVINKFKKIKRYKTGNLNASEWIELEEKIDKGEKLSKQEQIAYNKAYGKFQKSLEELKETCKSIKIPKIQDIYRLK